jgi:hypothetical protein
MSADQAIVAAGPKPFFTLVISVFGCRAALHVNDVPVFSEDCSDARIDVELPLNQWVHTGRNSLTARLAAGADEEGNPTYPLSSADVVCTLDLCVRPYGTPHTVRVRVSGIAYEGGEWKTGDAGTEGSPVRTLAGADAAAAAWREVELQTPFPTWTWHRAESLHLDDATTNELLAQYRRAWALLRGGDVDAVRALAADNAAEIQAAFFLPDARAAQRMLELEALAADPSMSLAPMALDLRMEVFGDGRLARLVDGAGSSPIRFADRNGGLDAYVGMMWCKLPARGWVMIR